MRRGFTGVVVLALALAACGEKKQNAAPAAPAAIDSATAARVVQAQKVSSACKLITLQEVRQITGLSLVQGPPYGDMQGYSECDWSVTPSKTDGIVLVVNAQGKFSDYATAPGAAPIKGYGDSASWNPKVHQLAVKRPTGTLAVSMIPATAKKEWADSIIKTVLGRLGSQAPATH